MCKRNTDDPLLRQFFDQYGLHLLKIPREIVAVGDVYLHDGKSTAHIGNVADLLTGSFELPPMKIGEAMADVAGKVSNKVPAKAGLNLADSFLAALGAGGMIAGLEAKYAQNKEVGVRFRFVSAVRDFVDVLPLGRKLLKHKLRSDQPLAGKKNRYFVVSGVAKSSAINISVESESSKSLDVDVKALQMAGVEAGVAVQKTNEGEVSFQGAKQLVFGVQLYELVVEKERNVLKLLLPQHAVRVLSDAAAGPVVEPAVIGGPDSDALFDVEYDDQPKKRRNRTGRGRRDA